MKKILYSITLLLCMYFSVSTNYAVPIVVDGEELILDVETIIKDDRTYVPVRGVLEKIGFYINWIQENQEVQIYKNNKKISMFIEKHEVITDDGNLYMEQVPFLFNDRTMVPLRFIAETFDYEVRWVDNKVLIGTNVTKEQRDANKRIDSFNRKTNKIGLKNQKFGSIAIGDNLNYVKSILGEPDRIDSLKQQERYVFNNTNDDRFLDYIIIICDKSGQVVGFDTTSSQWEINDALKSLKDKYKTEIINSSNMMISPKSNYLVNSKVLMINPYNQDIIINIYFDKFDNQKYMGCSIIPNMENINIYPGNMDLITCLEKEAIDLVNLERYKRGLNKLEFYEPALEVARAHSKDMFDRNYFSHINPDGFAPKERLTHITSMPCGENIHMDTHGTNSASYAIDSLMNSEGHRLNILKENYSYITIGIFQNIKNNSNYSYMTQNFFIK